MSDGRTLRIERTFQAPAQAVFDAWTSEEVMRRWWHAEHDWETTEATVDLRVGGAVRVVMRNPHEDIEYGGGSGPGALPGHAARRGVTGGTRVRRARGSGRRGAPRR